MGGLNFLLLGGSGLREEGGSNASSSDMPDEGSDELEVESGESFPRRLLRLADLVGSFWSFRGRGLLDEAGGGAVADEDCLL